MGTNYYLKVGEVQPEGAGGSLGNEIPALKHIGKSSCGWCFSLRVYPEEGIETIDDWMKLFEVFGIADEYGRELTAQEMDKVICARGDSRGDSAWDEKPFPYDNWGHFHQSNYSEKGPRGLVRSKICQTTGCVGHGSGTWDYIVGEFS